MNNLLESIFENRTFRNSKGETVKVNAETSREQCVYLQKMIQDHGFVNTLEIGFAYGTSTLAILEAISHKNGRHLVIDKFQHTGWGGNGLDLVRQAGYSDNLEFVEKYCYEVLPQLLQEGRQFDFAYIDSTKQFDWLLVDFFYIDKLLKCGGVVVFDDATFPGIRKLLRYISRWPNYEVLSRFPDHIPSSKWRKMAGALKFLPKANKYIKNDVLISDQILGLDSHCVTLRKTNDDKRNWDWHIDF